MSYEAYSVIHKIKCLITDTVLNGQVQFAGQLVLVGILSGKHTYEKCITLGFLVKKIQIFKFLSIVPHFGFFNKKYKYSSPSALLTFEKKCTQESFNFSFAVLNNFVDVLQGFKPIMWSKATLNNVNSLCNKLYPTLLFIKIRVLYSTGLCEKVWKVSGSCYISCKHRGWINRLWIRLSSVNLSVTLVSTLAS